MGDPKKLKKRYSTPMHPWNKDAIEVGKELKREYGLTKAKEILIANSFLKKYKNIAKKLTPLNTDQSEIEKNQVTSKLNSLGLISAGAKLDEILGLEIKHILERRLQSLVFRKGLAKSMKQARQFITHRHIVIEDKEITSPSYLTTLEEESKITFKAKSSIASEDHPERVQEKPVQSIEQASEQTEAEIKTKIKPTTIKEESEGKNETAEA